MLIIHAPLAMLMANLLLTQFTSPFIFAVTARTCLRILSLNIAFNGAIHYGIGGALYEISSLGHLQRQHGKQVMYSFIPGMLAYGITSSMLLCSPLTIEPLCIGFASLSFLQVYTFLVDKRYVSKE